MATKVEMWEDLKGRLFKTEDAARLSDEADVIERFLSECAWDESGGIDFEQFVRTMQGNLEMRNRFINFLQAINFFQKGIQP
jgi:hypothetical protein